MLPFWLETVFRMIAPAKGQTAVPVVEVGAVVETAAVDVVEAGFAVELVKALVDFEPLPQPPATCRDQQRCSPEPASVRPHAQIAKGSRADHQGRTSQRVHRFRTEVRFGPTARPHASNAGSGECAIGRLSVKTEPLPTPGDVASTSPWCARARPRAMVRPMPLPPAGRRGPCTR
jgi:hypothetical protein